MDRETAVRMWREAVGEHAIGLPPTGMMLEQFARRVEAAAREKTPSWWSCGTHGPGNHAAWGCPECVREMRTDIVRLRAALEWIASINAMDYEYQAKAREALGPNWAVVES